VESSVWASVFVLRCLLVVAGCRRADFVEQVYGYFFFDSAFFGVGWVLWGVPSARFLFTLAAKQIAKGNHACDCSITQSFLSISYATKPYENRINHTDCLNCS
jgi:hypothetical protein